MQNYKAKVKIISFIIIVFFVFLFSSSVLADSNPYGSSDPYGSSQPSGGNSNSIGNFIKSNSFTDLVGRIANWIFNLAVPIAVIMIIWSGILFMSAGGQEDKVTKAKRSLTWSIIGLAIAFIGIGFSSLILEIIGGSPDQITSQGLVNSLNRLAGFMYYLAPALAVIFLTWGGITYLFAGGDEKKIGDAKKRLWWGIIGAAVAIGVGVIIRTVMENLPEIRF